MGAVERETEERWPETLPTLLEHRWMPAKELDELHDLWPDYWPPAEAVYGDEVRG